MTTELTKRTHLAIASFAVPSVAHGSMMELTHPSTIWSSLEHRIPNRALACGLQDGPMGPEDMTCSSNEALGLHTKRYANGKHGLPHGLPTYASQTEGVRWIIGA